MKRQPLQFTNNGSPIMLFKSMFDMQKMKEIIYKEGEFLLKTICILMTRTIVVA